MISVEELKTERLKLNKLSNKDLLDYIEWKSQEQYHQFLPSRAKTTEEHEIEFADLIKNYNDKDEPRLVWGIFKNSKLIGSVSIEDWNTTHKWCEIGWGLNPRFQKQGFAYEAVKTLINYIFNVLNMNRISAVIWNGNDSSKKLALKCGFVQEGIMRKARVKNGETLDVYCYGLLKEEWQLKD